MKKRIILAISILLLYSLSFSQSQHIDLNNKEELMPNIDIIGQTDNSLTIKLTINSYNFEEVITPNGKEVIVKSPECNSYLKKGFPDIPYFSKSISIPSNSNYSFELISSSFVELKDVHIAPSKGSLLRIIDPQQVPYEYAEIYKSDIFYPESNFSTSSPFFIRDEKGITLNFSPFSYNAVTNELRIYNEIIVKLNLTNKKEKFQMVKKQYSEEFNNIYKRFFLNHDLTSGNKRYTPLEEGKPGRMLIISKDDFVPAMQEFVNWKREKGIITEMVKMSTVGSTSTDIKEYIRKYYNTHSDLIYILLVGDADAVPTNIHKGKGDNYSGDGHNDLDSDNEYAYLVGNDNYADVFIGRFSGNNISHIETQVKRSIYYEKNLSSSDTWLETSLSSASKDGKNPSDVEHLEAINLKLQNFGFTTTVINQIGGNNAKISAAINNGVAVTNYTGHGTVKTWSNTNYKNSEVNALQNKNKLPFIWSVACLNGQFRDSDCFAEAWLQANKDEEPTGAIAFLGSTILQAWVPPMYGQREMNDILIESYNNNIKQTIGGISFNGIFKIVEQGRGENSRTADTWTLFGDPSLMVRTKTPSENIVSHQDVIILGQNSINVSSNTEGALVSLSATKDNITEILGSGFIKDGSVQINFEEISIDDEIKLTVTAYNKITYQKKINVNPPEGPYISQRGFEINDSDLGGNNNNKVDYNEKFRINQKFKNVGTAKASQLKAEITTEDDFITIIKNSAEIGELVADQSITINNAFQISVDDSPEDQSLGTLKIKIYDNQNNTWNSKIKFIINSPKLNLKFVDITNDKGNTNISEGEDISIKFELDNIGHSKSKEGKIKIASSSSNINFSQTEINTSAIDSESSSLVEFKANISSTVSPKTIIPFTTTYTCGDKTLTYNGEFIVGIQIETWESKGFLDYDWINDKNRPWQIVSSEKYEGEYSLKSGKIDKGERTEFKIKLETLIDNDEIKFMNKRYVTDNNFGMISFENYFEFYINNIIKKKYDTNSDWNEEIFTLEKAGNYEFKWVMRRQKFSINNFEGYALLDNIKLPAHDKNSTSINFNTFVENNNIEIFPNPASENITVRIDSKNDTKVNIKILNINGQVVYENVNVLEISQGVHLIPISTQNLVNGTYIINILTNDYSESKRLIINK